MNDAIEREWFATYLRNSASPADAIALWRWGTEIDVRDILPAIHVPTLVVQSAGDRWVNVEEGRYLASQIQGARYLELPGRDHLIWGEDSDRLVSEIENFVTRTFPTATGGRELVSVLSLVIEGEAEFVPRLKEEVLGEILAAEGRRMSLSDGSILAVFQRPTRSIQCATAIRSRLQKCGLSVRSAVHVGECEQRGDSLSGDAVDLVARFLDHARSGEIIASRTVRDLVAGSGLIFEARGALEAVELFSVTATEQPAAL
jgi:hypothetical protein